VTDLAGGGQRELEDRLRRVVVPRCHQRLAQGVPHDGDAVGPLHLPQQFLGLGGLALGNELAGPLSDDAGVVQGVASSIDRAPGGAYDSASPAATIRLGEVNGQ
jgi:hypothetical protein